MKTGEQIQREWLLGATAFVGLGVAAAIFGFDLVGKFCLFAAPASIVFGALRRGMFSFTFGKRDLIRATDPKGFWLAVSLGTILALAQLLYFVERALHSTT